MIEQLRPYQFEGADALVAAKRWLLADEPGLGKSAQAIVASDLICATTILVICPAVTLLVWEAEFEKFSMFGHKIHVVRGMKGEPIPGMVNIVNYDLLSRGFEAKSYRHNEFLNRFKAIKWDVVICDEAHYLKEPTSLRTKAILDKSAIYGSAARVWFLTGTPMPNHPGELWTLLTATGANKLPYRLFIQRYCILNKNFEPIGLNPRTAKELKGLLRKIMTRRYKKFVLPQLPPIDIQDVPVPATNINLYTFFEEALGAEKFTKEEIAKQEDFVREIWQRAIASDGDMPMENMVAALKSIGPAVALYRRWIGALKTAAFLPMLEDELKTGALEKVVIFAYHKQVISFLKAKLKDYKPVVVDGTTREIARKEAVESFQNDPKTRVFIGNTIAAGTSITLTAAHEVIVLEPDWVPANNAQAIMRCHRIGQKNSVRARFVRLGDTLDDYITDVLMRKTKEIAQIVD